MRPIVRRVAVYTFASVTAAMVILAVTGFIYEQLGRNRDSQQDRKSVV